VGVGVYMWGVGVRVRTGKATMTLVWRNIVFWVCCVCVRVCKPHMTHYDSVLVCVCVCVHDSVLVCVCVCVCVCMTLV